MAFAWALASALTSLVTVAAATPLPSGDDQLCAVVEAVVGPRQQGQKTEQKAGQKTEQDQFGKAECLESARRKDGRLPVLVKTVSESAGKSVQKDIGKPGRLCGTAYVLAPRAGLPGILPGSDIIVYIEIGKTKDALRFYAWAGDRAAVTGGDATKGAGPCAADSGTLTRSGSAWQAKSDTDTN